MEQSPDRTRDPVEVAAGVHVVTARLYTTTSTVLVAEDGSCVVVDPAVSAAEVDGLARAVAQRGWRPVAGFSTHPHWDHVLWSEGLGTGPRWATAVAAQVAERERTGLVEGASTAPGHDTTLIARLTPLDPGATTLPWASRDVVVVEHGAHAPGAAALVVPDAKVLLAGDMLSDLEVPLLDLAAADPVGDYTRALDALEAAAERYGVDVLVPGHGHVADRDGLLARLAADRAYLAALRDGRTPADARLADAWLRAEHERQVAALAR